MRGVWRRGVVEAKEIHHGGMKEEILRKKDAHMVMSSSSTEENKNSSKSMKNIAKKAVSKTVRQEWENVFAELKIVHMQCLDYGRY